MAGQVNKVAVDTEGGCYDVLVGPLAAGLDALEALIDGRGVRIPLVSDELVMGFHGGAIRDRFNVEPLVVPRGEDGKTFAVLEDLLHRIAAIDPDRSTPIVALGGGAVGDLSGLAAALFKRGCPVVHIPTTLLAQSDSAVGGKTAIDFAGQKNLIGTFHQPSLVIADPSLLATLEPRQFRAGLAEIVKYGAIDDPAFFAWCEANIAALVAGHVDRLTDAIVHCVGAKARTVSGDVTDRSGKRALLNFGHSFAHAIEAECGLGEVLHGEAVAVGMVLALRFSSKAGQADVGEAERMAALLERAGLPTTLAAVGLGGRGDRLLKHMVRDKKNERGAVTLVLSHGIGRAFLQPGITSDVLGPFLQAA
jgi:3-dehydroquinate synthase